MLTSSQKSHVSRARQASHVVGSQSGRVAVLCGVLFLSGTGALIFETLWLRLSGLAFGNSIWAAALILSSFMAGLALGNALAASSRIRRWRPLHFYAVLEVLVAFFGCTIVFGLPVVGDLMRPVWQMLWNYQPTLLGLRFVVSFLILLVPTTAMGLTLPVIIEDPLLRETEFGRAIGFLYGSNTLGAMLGAVLGEAYLIGAFGLYGTSLAAGAAVCIAAAIALFSREIWSGAIRRRFQSADLAAHSKFPLSFDVSYRPPWRLLFVSFGTGCIFLALGSDLVSLPAAVRRVVCRRLSRSCSRLCWRELDSAVFWPERFIACRARSKLLPILLLAGSDFGASVVFIFSGRIDSGCRPACSTSAGGRSRFCVSH